MKRASVGLIGCGNIGGRIAAALLKSEYALTVYDVNTDAMNALVDAGARGASSPQEAASGNDVVITCVPTSKVVEDIVYGSGALVDALMPGQTLIDMTSALPESTRRIAKDLAERGVSMLDAPVTLSNGLSVMVGGPKHVFESRRPILEAIGDHVTWVGEAGAGNIAKLCQNIVTGMNVAIAGEIYAFAKKADVDMGRLEEALLTTGAADAARKFKAFASGNFDGSGQLLLHSKDLWYAMETAREIEATIPFTTLLHEVFRLSVYGGDRSWTQNGVVTYFEKAAGRGDSRS